MQYEEQSLRYHAISNIGIDTCGYTYQDIKESIPLYDKFTILFSDVFIFPKQYKANLISILCAYVLKIQSGRKCLKATNRREFFVLFIQQSGNKFQYFLSRYPIMLFHSKQKYFSIQGHLVRRIKDLGTIEEIKDSCSYIVKLYT